MAPALRDQIARDFIEVLKMPDVQAKYRALSVEPGGHTPAETAAFIKEEARIWGDVIRKNNIVVD
jgi:tripartite-type tricarboxylate transporter receptor subunit TctC